MQILFPVGCSDLDPLRVSLIPCGRLTFGSLEGKPYSLWDSLNASPIPYSLCESMYHNNKPLLLMHYSFLL